MDIIKGMSIDLKLMDESDIEQVRLWRNSKEVSNFMLSQSVISKDYQHKWFESIKNNPAYVYFIILSKEGEKLGVVSLNKIDKVQKTTEPGLYIGSTKHRNSLFGIEAYYRLLNFGFVELKLDKVFGTVLSSNKVAIKMNKSFGYTTDCILKDHIKIDDISHDAYKIWLSKEDFYASPMANFFKVK